MKYRIAKFSIVDLIVIASFSGLGVAIQLLVYPLVGTSPLGSGVVTSFFIGLLLALLEFIIRKFGTATIFLIILGTLLMPTPLVLPGPFKLLVVIPAGLVVDLLFLFLSKKELFISIITGPVANLSILVFWLYFLSMLGFHEVVQSILNVILFAILLGVVEGSIGSFIGYCIYNRIKDKPFVKRIQTTK